MKQSDLATVIVIGVVGVIVAFFACNAILGDPNEKTEKVTTIQVISAELSEPDPNIFNSDAINPTVEVYTTTQGTTEGE